MVDVARFLAALERAPRLRERLFTEPERGLPPASLAARFAAKEALAKALGAPGDLRWHDATVATASSAARRSSRSPGRSRRAPRSWGDPAHVSISHDAGIASAVVVAEG